MLMLHLRNHNLIWKIVHALKCEIKCTNERCEKLTQLNGHQKSNNNSNAIQKICFRRCERFLFTHGTKYPHTHTHSLTHIKHFWSFFFSSRESLILFRIDVVNLFLTTERVESDDTAAKVNWCKCLLCCWPAACLTQFSNRNSASGKSAPIKIDLFFFCSSYGQSFWSIVSLYVIRIGVRCPSI